jgi:photosystem II stability/assembly factor-like uncharacterized protein
MRSLARLFAPVFVCFPLVCQTIAPEMFAGLKWRLLGPFRAGRSIAVSGVAGSGSTFYFGGVDGGIWKTDDAGMVWTPIFDQQKSVGSIGALEVAPSDANVIYAGTGESDIRSNLASGDGMYRSSDAGKTWRSIGLKETRQISRVAVHPSDANLVFVAALGHAYGPNEERGVFRSTDGGVHWQKVLFKGPQIGAADLALASDAPEILFAAMWEAHRPPWSTYAPIAGPGSGLYRSKDGGTSWEEIKGGGFPDKQVGRIGVAIARGTRGQRIYVTVEAEAKQVGLYRSDDGGNIWTRVNADPRLTSRAWYFSSITADPNDPDVAYIPNVALYKVSEGGKALSTLRGAPGGDDYHQLWIDPSNSQRMGLATDQGTSISLNGGATWSSWYNQPTAQFYHVITDNQFPYHVYGAQQDSSTAGMAVRSDYGQVDARDRFSFGGSESGWVAIDPRDANIIYSSGVYGSVDRFDRRTGQSQNIAPTPSGAFGAGITGRKYRAPWTPVLLFSLSEPGALYMGTQYVMRTLDGGLHWQTVSPDLTGKTNAVAKPESVTVENAKELGYGVIYSIAPSPLRASEIWAGTDTGLIHLTRDGGRHWQNVTPEIGAWSKVTHIEVSHFKAGEAYAAVDRHRLDDRRPYLYKTVDYGKNWALTVEGIPEPAFLNCIREDPKRQGLLYAATEFGVYVSFDDGGHWQPLQLNLPVTSVRDLAIHDDDLVVATHGRAFWVLDNISPLRQMGSITSASNAYLFPPARAIRINNDRFAGTPVPPDEPLAKNPPNGAYIDYYLSRDSGDVSLTILNAQGKAIRRFSSKDKPAPIPANLPIAPRWFEASPQLSATAGMHRWIWDLRYGRGAEMGDDGDDGNGPPPAGPFVLPGTYEVRLSVDGEELNQRLIVRMDPRSIATAAELSQQFLWAQRAYADAVKAGTAVASLIALNAQSADSGVKTRCQELLNGKQGNPGLQPLVRSLNALLGALESADRMPPSQVIAAYTETAQKLAVRLKQSRALLGNSSNVQ